MVNIRSKTPLRVSFAGGGTDVPPYADDPGGMVLSTTIDKFAYCTLRPRGDGWIIANSLDYHKILNYPVSDPPPYEGNLDLVVAAMKTSNVRQGVDLYLHSDVPPGSGLGSSSALCVTLIGGLKHLLKQPIVNYEIAQMAYHVEREEVGIQGGKQDQYACAFGGFNFIEFYKDQVIVNPLRIKKDILNEIEYRCILCDTGRTRLSAGIIADQVARYENKEETTTQALHQIKDSAVLMKNALLLGHVEEFGSLLHEAWLLKRKLSPLISDASIDELYETSREAGVLGGKLLGAGGGGYLLLFCEPNRRQHVIERLTSLDAKVVSFAFESEGLQTWEFEDK